MEHRTERVVLETGEGRIVGDVTLPREGYRSRLSDYLNQGDLDFIPLVNVEITDAGGGEPRRLEFAAVARRRVLLAYPLDEAGGGA